MHNKIVKITVLISVFITIISIFPSTVFGDWAADAQSFLEASKDEDIGINKYRLKEASDDIYNMVTSIGMVISVIVGLSLGIKFMMSNAGDKAKVKESLIPYILGSFITFGAFGIWKIIVNTFNGI